MINLAQNWYWEGAAVCHQTDGTYNECRLVAVAELDMLEFFKMWQGRDWCDDVEDRRDVLLTLPMAIAEAERRTNRSVLSKCWELYGRKPLGCKIELPFGPVQEILAVHETSDNGATWSERQHSFLSSLSDRSPELVLPDTDRCLGACRCPRCCGCPEWFWRIRYRTGQVAHGLLPTDPLTLRLIFAIADNIEANDAQLDKTIDRLVKLLKPKRM